MGLLVCGVGNLLFGLIRREMGTAAGVEAGAPELGEMGMRADGGGGNGCGKCTVIDGSL